MCADLDDLCAERDCEYICRICGGCKLNLNPHTCDEDAWIAEKREAEGEVFRETLREARHDELR